MKKIIFFILPIIIVISGCDVIDEYLKNLNLNPAPSDSEIVQGLKKALEIGVQSAVNNLHKKDGYYKNPKVKIPLPPEVQKTFNYALSNSTVKTLGLDKILQKKINNFVIAINRSAEQAAIDAKPIFLDAVKGLSISQGLDILKGRDLSGRHHGFDSLAATHYLELKTRNKLFSLYKPKIDNVLNKDLGLGFSANQAWNTTISYYNNYIASVIGKPKINYTLSTYATNKALDGLFYMIGQEEKKIRRNPYKYTYDIIKKVFGYVYRK